MTQMKLCEKETDSQTQRIDLWLPRGSGQGEGWTRSLDLQMQTITFSMDKQVPTVEHRNYIQYPVINHNGKGFKQSVYMGVTESFCYTAEIGTTL